MRAMTVRHPWAWSILHGTPVKDVENRVRNIAGTYRGTVAIHAGLREDEAAYDDPMIRQSLGHIDDSWELLEQLETGVFIGVVDLLDVHKHWVEHHEYGPVSCCASPWAMNDHWHLVLGHPRPLRAPVPARGKLGLWTPSTTEIAAIVQQLPEVD